MKRYTIIIMLLFSISVFGQDSTNTKPATFKRLLIGVNFSPDLCYRTLKTDREDISWIVDLRNKGEGPKFGYTAGINACYNISSHLGIETGIQYSNKGYAFKKSKLIFGDMTDPRYGYVYSNGSAGPTSIKILYNHIYLDIPVRAVFSFGKSKIHFVTSVGVTTNILLKASQTWVFEYDNKDKKRDTFKQNEKFKTINLSPTVSAGINYKITSKMNLSFEPTFRYGVMRIVDAPIKGYLWSGGLNITYYYELK